MEKIKITEATDELFKKRLLNFINNYGDGHITKKAITWLQRTPFSEIKPKQGNLIHVLLNKNKKIIAVLAISNFGLDQAIVVLHPNYRKKGLAKKLNTEALTDINRFYVRVANDNIPSLKLCFSLGMQAFSLIKGPTGKPTLVLGMGKWRYKEWEAYQKTKSL